VLLGLLLGLLLSLWAGPLLAAQEREALPERGDGDHVHDDARVINGVDEQALETELQALQQDGDIDIVIFTQELQPVGTRAGAREDATRVLEEWQVGGESGRGAVMLWNINPETQVARSGVALGSGFSELDARSVDTAVTSAVQPGLASGDWKSAWLAGRIALEASLSAQPLASPAPRTPTEPGATSDIGSIGALCHALMLRLVACPSIEGSV
jgi:uncharacterized membrane protein YgcG